MQDEIKNLIFIIDVSLARFNYKACCGVSYSRVCINVVPCKVGGRIGGVLKSSHMYLVDM